jgi:DNA processing protein
VERGVTGDHGIVAALAGLPAMGPKRLSVLLTQHEPAEALDVVRGGRPPHPSVLAHASTDVLAAWRAAAGRLDPEQSAARCTELGVRVLQPGDPDFPPELVRDAAPPAVLFARGDLRALDRRRVAIVGTRNATRGGIETAVALGHDLAEAGVTVLSGLALGIDAAAHRGALRAAGVEPSAVAVVGSGPDVVYPRRHAALWDEICARGLLLTEWPPGTRPDAFRFPLRNRLIAGLSEVLVVVESRERGGSLLTAAEAIDRSVTVMAVPGSPRNRAAAGTNRLIVDGATPVLGADDVLVALGLDTARRDRTLVDNRRRPVGVEADVLERCRRDPCTLDEITTALGLPVAEAAMALARLERSGWVAEAQGWFEAVGPPEVGP